MRQAEDHPLVRFIYQTFGPHFADLIMLGYGEEPSREKKVFHITEEIAGRSVEWTIEAISNSLPYRREPLVIAALLNILLKRPVISTRLEFQMDDLVEEIGRDYIPTRHEEIDRIITNYVSLSFFKEPKNEGVETDDLRWGNYSLIIMYLRDTVRTPGESVPERKSRSIEIDRSFIEGIKKGQVFFSDINFGPLCALGVI